MWEMLKGWTWKEEGGGAQREGNYGMERHKVGRDRQEERLQRKGKRDDFLLMIMGLI